MASRIPEGYELLPGPKTTEKAREALALATDRGLDPTVVLTVADGFLIPVDEIVSDSDEGEPIEIMGEPIPDESWKVDEIDAWAAENDISFEGLEDQKKATKLAHILASIPGAQVIEAGDGKNKED